jgi:hypothetical protein
VLSRIQASQVDGVSVTICESAPTLFSLTFSETTGVASADESTRDLWKVFQ